ncbi:hypothetical protein DN310_01685 [Salmonella enterica subsp. salamae]|uniref:Uncharacterized protein n=1 Tax=Salmonella enterica subsp. salamae TaxID=59202 RepID=A0A5Y3MJC8_SALER|nr:hypothetical protein [Salmonella enterica subsp. salamae]
MIITGNSTHIGAGATGGSTGPADDPRIDGIKKALDDTQIGLPRQPIMWVSTADDLSSLPVGAYRFARNKAPSKVLPTDSYVYLEVTGKRDTAGGSCIQIVEYLSPQKIWTGIRNNTNTDAEFTWIRQPFTPGLFTPAGDISRWTAGIDSTAGTADWKITRGTRGPSAYYLQPTNTGQQWEIQHPISGVADLFRYQGRVRFNFYYTASDDAATEGKDLLEVRLVIPDDIIPSKVTVPPPTPDRPYLAVGFIVRRVNGQLKVYDLDTDITSPQLSAISGSTWRGTTSKFGMTFYSGFYCYAMKDYSNYRRITPVRTGVNTPVNTLCIRSGDNPVRETGFSYLESRIPREILTHRLTLEDVGATFYCPYAYPHTSLILPDTPFPTGFSINLIAEGNTSNIVHPENKNVTIITGSDALPASSDAYASSKKQLIQVGPDGKTWSII